MSCLATRLILLVLALTWGAGSQAAELGDLAWLEGTWQRESSRGPVYEQWKRLSDNTWEGGSWRQATADGPRRTLEWLLLVKMGGELFYIPKVGENAFPVPFKMTSLADDRAVFENLEHDFPQRIIYQRRSDSAMHVRIEGPGDGGQTQGIEFEFTRAR